MGESPANAISPPQGDGRELILSAFREVAERLRRARRSASPNRVHRLRVVTRRTGAVVAAFEDRLDRDLLRKGERRLRSARRLVRAVRECDMISRTLREESEVAALDSHGLDAAFTALERERVEAVGALGDPRAKRLVRRLRRSGERLAAGLPVPEAADLPRVARRALAQALESAEEAGSADLSEPGRLHDLRLALKRVRYTAEVFQENLPVEEAQHASLARAQIELGTAADTAAVSAWLTRFLKTCPPDARAMARQWAEHFAAKHAGALAAGVGWWRAEGRALIAALRVATPEEPQVPAPVVARVAPLSPALADLGPLPGSPRLAAIDIGSNSIRLIVAEAEPEGTYRVLDDEREVARLGEGVSEDGRLDEGAVARAAGTVARMRGIAEGYGVRVIRAVATSAVRDASNRARIVDLMRERTGLEVEVVSGEEEARLAWLSASRAFDLTGARVAVVDLGGGSAQVVLAAAGVVERAHSIPIGAVRMTDRFGGPEECAGPNHAPMRRFIAHALRREIGRPPFSPALLIGTGGTFTTLAHMLLHQRRGEGRPTSVQGLELHRSELAHLLERLRATPVRERQSMPGLPADRADIIVAGLTAVDCILDHLGVNAVQVHDRGIRDGLILTMVRDLFALRPSPGSPPDSLASARRFARACRYEEAHAEHVTALALSLFDDLAAAVGGEWSAGRARVLLEAAGVLHDVGYLINYTGHHKHSYHLITHSELEGFTGRELEVVANIARYHRRAEPRKRHPGFARLAAEDREVVRRLAAILRIADGLDRTHTQAVRSVRAAVAGCRAEFTVETAGPVETDVWGAERKSGLFREQFGLEPKFTVVGLAEPTGDELHRVQATA